ncbi:hypothetical protein IAU60_002827 [Kwoniella sp. DSM 27419]
MGGDHKCPLCSATFTRPQHVGRHLRAHTGDRPYECKECPLRDLLSRHVNKAHKPPDENAPQDKKQGKKGRRKSFPASTKPRMPQPADGQMAQAQELPPQAHMQQQRDKPRAASFNQQPQLQARSMYPHHPLLSTVTPFYPQPQAQTWNGDPSQAYASTAAMTGFVNPVAGTGNPNAILGNTPYPPTFDAPYTAQAMRMSGSDQGYTSSINMPPSGITYEWVSKKRACDQCNHSKVRCDFSDPCVRCAHRNLPCTYNKPQRARTQGYSMVASSTSPNATNSQVSSSPQSHFSSPLSATSPIAPTVQRQSSGSAMQQPLQQWPQYAQVPVQPYLTGTWPPQPLPSAAAPLPMITGQMQDSPGSMHPPLSTHRRTSQMSAVTESSSNASPQQAMAPTPSLTNNTISPPDIDEPFERRTSFPGTTVAWQDAQAVDPAFVNPPAAQFQPMQAQPMDSAPEPYQWPAAGLDEETIASSVSSSYVDLAEAQTAHRRRSSAGTWAHAMAQMSLQDPVANATESQPLPINTFVEPPRRPTFPTLGGVNEESEVPIPSLSDVKDLWRLFMAEPMTGQTPAGERHDDLGAAPLVTPRHGMGKRTLSKSNSMPDLQSPIMNGPAFFTGFLNGITPKPTEGQSSYMPPPQPVAGSSIVADDPDMGKWSKAMQQRQSSFSLASQPKGKPIPSVPGVSTQAARPGPSAVQRFSALEQTLAPERLPSFGMPQFGYDVSLQSPAQSQLKMSARVPNALPAHLSRPGNKRLASQTLVGDAGKKATFTLYDEGVDQPDLALSPAMGGLTMGMVGSMGMMDVGGDASLFQMPPTAPLPKRGLASTSMAHMPSQGQEQHLPQQGMANQPFYPQWAYTAMPGPVNASRGQ